MVRHFITLAFLFCFFSLPAVSQEITAKASADKSDYLVGDYINYSIQVDCDTSLRVYPPSIKDSLKNVSLIRQDSSSVEKHGGTITTIYKYILSGYDSVGVNIPPITVQYRQAGDTTTHYALANGVGFTVRTVQVNLQKDIKDVKSPIKIPLDWRWVLLWIVVALAVAAIVYYLYHLYKKRKSAKQPTKKEIILPPHVMALKDLKDLETQRLWQRGLTKEYHSRITEIIRRYFEGRFAMPALELPTSEAVELLRQKQGSEPIQTLTRDFLSNADLVKFAKYTPLNQVNEEMMKQAYEIVNKTAPIEDGDGTTGTGQPDKSKVGDISNVH